LSELSLQRVLILVSLLPMAPQPSIMPSSTTTPPSSPCSKPDSPRFEFTLLTPTRGSPSALAREGWHYSTMWITRLSRRKRTQRLWRVEIAKEAYKDMSDDELDDASRWIAYARPSSEICSLARSCVCPIVVAKPSSCHRAILSSWLSVGAWTNYSQHAAPGSGRVSTLSAITRDIDAVCHGASDARRLGRSPASSSLPQADTQQSSSPPGHLREAQAINSSLSSPKRRHRCTARQAAIHPHRNSKLHCPPSSHTPHRNSKLHCPPSSPTTLTETVSSLTFLLQDQDQGCLRESSRVIMMANVSLSLGLGGGRALRVDLVWSLRRGVGAWRWGRAGCRLRLRL